MSRLNVSFPDPIEVTLDILRAAGTGATFGTLAPSEFPTETVPAFPWVTVTVDNSTGDYPVSDVVTLRVRVWSVDGPSGYSLAQSLRGHLLGFAGSRRVRTYTTRTGPIPTVDPDDGTYLTAFTVAASLKPIL